MIRVGDKVKILNERAEGIVQKILGPKSVLVRVDGFDYEYSLEKLLRIGEGDKVFSGFDPERGKIHPKVRNIISEEEPRPKALKKIKLKKGSKTWPIPEIDLHSHEIIEDCSGMNRTQILAFQLNYFKRELDLAIARKEKGIVFIHGKGEGVLRSEIRKILKSYDNIDFFDAPLKIYGGGATQVEIH